MFHRILAPLDGSSLAECVLPHLAALARTFDAEVELVHVLACNVGRVGDPVDPLSWEMRKAEARSYLDEVSVRLAEAGIDNVSANILEGEPAQRIVEFAQSRNVDLVVLSSHGQAGLNRWNVSSVVRKVIQCANRSIFLVRAYTAPETESPLTSDPVYKRLLVPVDGSRRAECALNVAVTVARTHGADLLLGHVVAKPEMPSQVPLSTEDNALLERFTERCRDAGADYLEQLRGRLSMDFEALLSVSDDRNAALHALVDEQRADLVVLCAHGFSGKSRWPFGSVATSFIEYGNTPLLMVQDLDPNSLQATQAELAAVEIKGY
jgi:nucleotide-binding universal stress UspA family protein